MRRFSSIFVFLAVVLPSLAGANITVSPEALAKGVFGGDGQTHAEARLLVDHDTVAPGQTFRAGVLVSLDENWHTYWHNPGESALPSENIWSADQAESGRLQWPAPTGFPEMDGELWTFGYADEVLLFAPLSVSDSAGGTLQIHATFKFLVCEIQCVPFTGKLSRTIAVAENTNKSSTHTYFEKYAPQIPVAINKTNLSTALELEQVPVGNRQPFRGRVVVDTCLEGTCDAISFDDDLLQVFFHHTVKALDIRLAGIERVSDHRYILNLEGESRRNFDPSSVTTLTATLRYMDADNRPAAVDFSAPFVYDEHMLVADAPAPAKPVGKTGIKISSAPIGSNALPDVPFWQILVFALIGGIILNVMPCVFPVLAIKVAAFTDLAQKDRTSILAHGGAYTAGILAAMLTLAVVVIGLKTAGTSVGWGFQFQDPRFVAILAAIVVLFALNLFGVYQIGVAAQTATTKTESLQGLARSAGEGVLAVILATPCSAPFLGTAIGFAFSASAMVIVLVFSAIGLGLALPFVLLTLMPGTAKYLPKPGHWMDQFKRFLGFLLLGTAVWLIGVLGTLAGNVAVTRTLFFLLILAYAAWTYGALQYRSGARKWLPITLALALIVITGKPLLNLSPQSSAGSTAVTAMGQPYSEQAVQDALAQGKPVFVDFTADWCITCKFNEQRVLKTATVQEMFREQNVAFLIADWTHYDDNIRATLARFGKAGVPMYLVYHPDHPNDPKVLPELLTTQMLREALED